MLKEQIAEYLTTQFICNPKDLPENECMGEAKYILALIRKAVKNVGNPSYPAKCETEVAAFTGFEQARETILKMLE